MKSKNQILVGVIKNLASVLTKSEAHNLNEPDVVNVTYCLWKLSSALELKDSFARDSAIRYLNDYLIEGKCSNR